MATISKSTSGDKESTDLIAYSHATGWSCRNASPALVGMKALGLSLIPESWRPPFFVIPATVYARWRELDFGGQQGYLTDVALGVVKRCLDCAPAYSAGVILRSSASSESLRDRGAFTSKKLAADFGTLQIAESLAEIYVRTGDADSSIDLAVVVQPLVGDGRHGHLSNERRVSKTVNQWEWEQTYPFASGRINSQRVETLQTEAGLLLNSQKQFVRRLREVGRWITQLNRGPAHLEWAMADNQLWIVQLDFENDAPDDGVDPSAMLRAADVRAPGRLRAASQVSPVDFGSGKYPWKKVENVRVFLESRSEAFPPIFLLQGDRLKQSDASKLEEDLEAIAHGRIVCRTDCNSEQVSGLNLPRTHTVNSACALQEMSKFLADLADKGVSAEQICFILHRFIPAKACAWVRADPNSQFVMVDSLWGVPDGLQYLPYDSFEYDINRGSETGGGRLRYKPRFIQETADGSWQELRVQRSLARHRSLHARDVKEIATTSHLIAAAVGRPTLIMWFCGIPNELGIGSNLPWFRMQAREAEARDRLVATPQWPRRSIRGVADLERLAQERPKRQILALDPDVEFIRKDDAFLGEVIRLSKELNLPVELAGSTLSHPFYQLEESGVSVVLKDENKRSRVLRRQSFDKLVRDKIPTRIEQRGEVVVQASLPRSELRRALVAKLFEEGLELVDARDPEEVREELADLLEVVLSLASTTGVEWRDVEETANKKRNDRGSFGQGAVLVETSWPSPGRVGSAQSRTVLAASLAHVESGEQKASTSFGALVSQGRKGVAVSIAGNRFTVRLNRDSIEIVADGSEPSPRDLESLGQIPLPLPSRDRGTK